MRTKKIKNKAQNEKNFINKGQSIFILKLKLTHKFAIILRINIKTEKIQVQTGIYLK